MIRISLLILALAAQPALAMEWDMGSVEVKKEKKEFTGEGREILFFTASWCGPCKQVKPRLKGLTGLIEVDCSEENPLDDKFRNVRYPTVIYSYNGVEVKRCVGNYITRSIVKGWLKSPSVSYSPVSYSPVYSICPTCR